MITTLSFGQDLAVNGSFENWTAGVPDSWVTDFNTTDLSEDATVFSEGAKSAKIVLMTIDQRNTDTRQTVTVAAGTTYDVSVKVYATDNQARVRLYAGDYRGYSDDTLLNQWQTITYEYTATADEDVEFGIRLYDTAANWTGAGSTFYIDEFKIMPQTTPSIVITSPESGDFFETGSINISYSVANFAIADGSTDATQDGHVHWKIDEGDVSMVYDPTTADIAVSDIANGMHTLHMFLVDNSHTALDPPVEASVDFVVGYTQVADITALRADIAANGEGNYYEITGNSLVTHTDSYKNRHWLQDDTISGILIYDKSTPIMSTYNVGDNVSGLKGKGDVTYHGVIQLLPTEDAGTVNSSGNTVTPQIVDIATFNAAPGDYQSELIQINEVTFADADGTAVFETNTSYDFSDGTNTAIMRTIFYGADYIGAPIPSGSSDLVGVTGVHNGTGQLFVRSLADITVASVENNTIEGFELYPNPLNGSILNITTLQNLDKKVQIFNLLGKQVLSEIVVGKTMNLSKLNTGIYIIKVQEGSNTATSKLVIR